MSIATLIQKTDQTDIFTVLRQRLTEYSGDKYLGYMNALKVTSVCRLRLAI